MDPAAHDAELVRRARAARRAGDEAAAQRCAAELWLRYRDRAATASRRRARGVEAEEVLGLVRLRFVRWVYDAEDLPRNMGGLISQMAAWSYADMVRDEVRQPTPLEDLREHGADDDALDRLADVDLLDRLLAAADLTDRERLLLERQREDVPDAILAEELGVTPNNLHQIRFRAFAKVRAALSEEDDAT